MAKKYIDADRLKAELTKHYDEYKTKFHQDGERYYLELIDGIEMTERIIDSLQQEQPCNRAIYLDVLFSNMKRNEAIKQLEYLNKVYGEQPCDTCTNDKGCVTCKDGELWEGKEQPSEDLEEAANEIAYNMMPVAMITNCEDGHPDYDAWGALREKFIEGFKAGAEWQKEQMLKAALEGEAHPNDCEIWVNFEDYGYKFNDGDKIKIIIVPIKEDK